jgi:hypothetical protein
LILSISLGDVESVVSTISSVTVIVGAVFVIIQLRLTAKDVTSHNAFELIGKVIDPSFPGRRHRLYMVSAKYSGGDWTGFDRSLDDFEVRNFANIYEQLGLLVKKGVIDLPDVMQSLSAQVLADWNTFKPIRTHIMDEAAKAFPLLAVDRPGIDDVYWPNFMWLAEENGKWVMERLSTGSGSPSPSAN